MAKINTLVVAVCVATGLSAMPAAAQSLSPYADLRAGGASQLDLAPTVRERWMLPSSSTQLSLTVSAVQRPEGNDYSGGLMLSMPTDWLAGLGSTGSAGSSAGPSAGSSDVDVDDARAPHRAPEPLPPITAAEPSAQSNTDANSAAEAAALPQIHPADIRAVADAADAAYGFADTAASLDGLSTRARWSGLLPDLRLRATRQVDEDSALSPTSYDPNRVTSSGGVSLWLEARASWRLDRLLFGDEEVRIEKLRRDVSRDRRKHGQRAVALLLAWQQALYLARDPLTEPRACLKAWFEEQQLAAELDGLTAGWHSDWLARHTRVPEPWCVVELVARVQDQADPAASAR